MSLEVAHKPQGRDYRPLDLHRLTEYHRLDELIGRHRIVRELVEASPEDRALEIGCAQGYWVNLYLRPRVRSVIGLDLDRYDVRRGRDYARRHPAPGAKPQFLTASAQTLPLPDDAFTLVYCMDVIEHVDDPRQAAQEARRVLAPGGTLVVTVPGHWAFNFLDRHYPEHRHYRASELIDLFPGLEVQFVHQTGLLWATFWGTYVRFVVSRATRLIPGPQRRARMLRALHNLLSRIADLDLRLNYGFGSALAVVFRKPSTSGARITSEPTSAERAQSIG